MSRCRMISLGGDSRWIGWDSNSELAASQHDLIHQLAKGDKFTESDRYPRPGHAPKHADGAGELFAPTLADFSVPAFMQVINS